jgi:phenylpropionate dioxygenase-like ring-hydroxylating dioxygenase large terminal subunit
MFYILTLAASAAAYTPAFFSHWHCLHYKSDIDTSKPVPVSVGGLPLVLWKDEAGGGAAAWHATLDICPHMGSKLSNAKIIDNCLQCQYHGLNITAPRYGLGCVVEHEEKLYWSYKPTRPRPPATPFYGNPEYARSHIVIDMEASLHDCVLNTMDIRHPEYVHNGLMGFGTSVQPRDVRHYTYPWREAWGLEFQYTSSAFVQQMNKVKSTHNFHLYQYPLFTWSKVSFLNKNLIITVDFAPLSEKKTRWFVSVFHNYNTQQTGLMNLLARKILLDDFVQMKNQNEPGPLKSRHLFKHPLGRDEDLLVNIHRTLQEKYAFPTAADCAALYDDWSKPIL